MEWGDIGDFLKSDSGKAVVRTGFDLASRAVTGGGTTSLTGTVSTKTGTIGVNTGTATPFPMWGWVVVGVGAFLTVVLLIFTGKKK